METTDAFTGAISPTRMQLQCMQVICEWSDTYGRTPSYREIAVELDLPSPGSVQWLINRLEERRWVARVPHRPGAVRMLHRPPMPDFTEIEWSLAPDLVARGEGDRNA